MPDESINWSNLIDLSRFCDKGNFRVSNEDSYVISELILNDSNDSILFLGIFDGHAGKECSEFLESNFPKYLDGAINNLDINEIEENITQVCHDLNNDFIKSHSENPAGSCAIMGFVIPQGNEYMLLTANVGDSQGALIDYQKSSTSLNRLHKPNDPVEKEYIESHGGEVYQGRIMGLAVSRAFGDKDIIEYGLRVDPEFSQFQLEKKHEYIVYGSDGIWDVLKEEEIAILLAENESNDNKAKLICEKALEKKSMDNVTVIVADIRKIYSNT